jgi:hypothetical protein
MATAADHINQGFSPFPEISMSMSQEPIELPPSMSGPFEQKLDPNWQFVDAQGHGHFTRPDDSGVSWAKRLPTLEERTEPCGDEEEDHSCMVEECDLWLDTNWHCKICDEIIEPGTVSVPRPTHLPGPVTISITMTTVQDVGGPVVTHEYQPDPEALARCRSAVARVVHEQLSGYIVSRKVGLG